jgi:excisionase family DNA binding protein
MKYIGNTEILVQEVKQALPTILSVKEVASLFDTSENTIRKMLKEGKLKGFREVGTAAHPWSILRSDLIDFFFE